MDRATAQESGAKGGQVSIYEAADGVIDDIRAKPILLKIQRLDRNSQLSAVFAKEGGSHVCQYLAEQALDIADGWEDVTEMSADYVRNWLGFKLVQRCRGRAIDSALVLETVSRNQAQFLLEQAIYEVGQMVADQQFRLQAKALPKRNKKPPLSRKQKRASQNGQAPNDQTR